LLQAPSLFNFLGKYNKIQIKHDLHIYYIGIEMNELKFYYTSIAKKVKKLAFIKNFDLEVWGK
jgi:hypothetical protein